MKLNRVKQSPTGLTGIESFGFPEILEVFVVCDDGEGMVSSLQPMPPLFQGQFNGQQLPVADVEVLLRWGKFLGIVCARVEAWRLTELRGQNSSDSSGGGVHFYHKRYMGVRMTKDGSRAECRLELLEGFVGAETPGQGLGLTSVVNGAVCRLKSWMKRR